MPIIVTFDEYSVAEAKHALDGIKEGLITKATVRALNKTCDGVRTDLVALIRKDYNHKAEAIRKRIWIDRASAAKPSCQVVSRGRSIHLTDIATTAETTKGVTVNVKKNTGRRLLRSAFVAASKVSGKRMVFWRVRADDSEKGHTVVVGKSKGTSGSRVRLVGQYPIKSLYAPHPEIIYNTDENWPTIQNQAQARLDKNFAHEVTALLKGYAK
jgi:hypothetical protein